MKLLLLSLFIFCSLTTDASDLILAKEIKIESTTLKESRNLLIKLPENYDKKDATYPVLYLLHGQWDMLSTISTLDLLSNQLPQFIVVGVESRGMELRPKDGKVTQFARYLTQEVVEYVKKNYSAANYSILSGHSNSGRFVLDFWLNDSKPFSQYFAFSPSLDDGYIVEKASNLPANAFQNKAPLTLTIANEGEHMQEPFEKLSNLLKKRLPSHFESHKFPEESHNTTKHPSMQYALQTTFKNWVPSYETKIGGLDGLVGHYSKLTQKFGFKVAVPVDTLQQLVGYYATSKADNAIKDLEQFVIFTLQQSTDGTNALLEIVDYLSANGYQEAGDSVLTIICTHDKKLKQCNV